MVPARIGLGYRLENRVIRNFAPCLNFLRRHSLGVRDRLRDSKDSKVADVTKGCARSRPHEHLPPAEMVPDPGVHARHVEC